MTEEIIEELHKEYTEVPSILKKLMTFEGYIVLRECSTKSEIVKSLKEVNERMLNRAS